MGLKLTETQTVFVDTAPLIYFFEAHEVYAPLVEDILNQASALGVQLVTSMITYIELLTHPRRAGDERLAAKYRDYLTNAEQISLYPLNALVADATVDYRARYKLRMADAIQLGTARVCGADYVLTNDRDWGSVTDLKVVLLSDLVPA
jgi:predicted nucleic acid-binding protein